MDMGTAWMLLQSGVGQAAEKTSSAVGGADIRIVAKCIGAAFAIGIGVFAPGLTEGYATAKAVEGVARNPGATNLITRTLLIGQAVTESNSIYALVVALLILFVIV
jgi:F-type H+-transporting ATPase subunit c